MVKKTRRVNSLRGAVADASSGADLLDSIFRDLILHSPISTWIADSNGTTIFENAACRQLFGIDSDDQVVGKYNLFKDEELERLGVLPDIRRTFEEAVPFEALVDYDFAKVKHVSVPHAAHRYLRALFFPITDQSGKVRYVVVQHEDYTEKRGIEKKLREERDRARSYLDVAGVMIVVISRDDKVALINRRGCEILGYREREILGRNWFDSFIPERIRQEVRGTFAKLTAGELEVVEYYENPVLTRTGEERIIAWHNAVLKDDKGRIYATLSSGDDLTERKRAEDALQLFRYAAESSVAGLLMVDHNGRIIYMNSACAGMHGYEQGELQGRDSALLYDDPALAAEILSAVLRAGKWVGETVGRRKDGSTFIKEERLSAISLPDQEALGVLVISQDVTLERRTDESRRRLEAHFEEQRKQFYKQTILAATGGKLVICEPGEIADLGGEIVGEYRVREPVDVSRARHLVIDVAAARGMPPTRAESFALCVGEAATNALKHASGGEVALSAKGSRLRARISDHGPGMDALILPKAILQLGYSTSGSLGMGYALILSLSDRVHLCTGPAGTTVVIEMDMQSPARIPSIEAFPDTW